DCETYTFTWPQAALVSIEPLAVAVDGFAEALADQETSCAAGVGDFADCDLETPCVTGLLCAGLIRSTVLTDTPWGLCMDEGNVGVFDGAGAAIPDGGPTLAINLEADGLTTVDTDVVIWVDTDHPAPEELVITLENPSGNVVPVWSKLPGPMHPGGLGIVPTGFSGDESVNGTWTLYVSDTVANGVTGDVLGWRLEIMSRYD
ncbi:MAG: proprotein convertase P-domain-containing protein, partial [Myxococcales bacterium]|nr:proprotein convertase P-domain-containing protein [Myxococcales bacterium]